MFLIFYGTLVKSLIKLQKTQKINFSLQYDKKHHLIIQQDTSQQLQQLLIDMI